MAQYHGRYAASVQFELHRHAGIDCCDRERLRGFRHCFAVVGKQAQRQPLVECVFHRGVDADGAGAPGRYGFFELVEAVVHRDVVANLKIELEIHVIGLLARAAGCGWRRFGARFGRTFLRLALFRFFACEETDVHVFHAITEAGRVA